MGPGGFTGLRIGIATALGLGQALGVPVTGASTLEAMALGIAGAAPPGAVVAPVIDARRREVFTGIYRGDEGGGLTQIMGPTALAPARLADAVAALGAPVWVAGDGVGACGSMLATPPFVVPPASAPVHRLRAADLVRRVAAGAGLPAVPVYARLPDAEVNRLRAAAG